jgi:hypothetical protein
MVIHFFYKICSRTRETSHIDFSIGCGARLAYQDTQKLLDKKSLVLCSGLFKVT